jgi:hypothetical protein
MTILTVLNIVLIVAATASTLSAVGGTTCREGDAPVWKRLTARGWVALGCLALTFFFGIVKEVLTRAETKLTESKEKQKQEELANSLTSANSRLAAQSELMESEKKRLEAMQKKVDEADSHVADVRSYLAATRANILEQSTTNLVTQLSSGNRTISEIWIMFPVMHSGPQTKNAQDIVLKGLNQDGCSANDQYSLVGNLKLGNQIISAVYPKNIVPGPPDSVVIDGSEPMGSSQVFRLVNQLANQKSVNRYVLTFRVRPPNEPLNLKAPYSGRMGVAPSEFVSSMSNNPIPFTFFLTRDLNFSGSRCISTPKIVKSTVFDTAVVVVVLDNPAGQAFYYNLRARALKDKGSFISLEFQTDSSPEFIKFPILDMTSGLGLLLDHPEINAQ